jgi:DNA-binding MurR/RpiR family transcriptional regulator
MNNPPARIHAMPVQDNPQLKVNSRTLTGRTLYFQAPLASRITQLAVIDAIFVSLALKHKNRTANRLQQSGEELLKRRLRSGG